MELVSYFQSFRSILCICPCCNGIHRLSDLQLRYEGKAASTWLDQLESKSMQLDEKEAKFEEKEQGLRDLAAERGRKKVVETVRRSMIRRLARLKLNPYDIKSLMHPVDFVVFNGMNDDKFKEILFLSDAGCQKGVKAAALDVEKAVKSKKYEWKVARVDVEGKVEWE